MHLLLSPPPLLIELQSAVYSCGARVLHRAGLIAFSPICVLFMCSLLPLLIDNTPHSYVFLVRCMRCCSNDYAQVARHFHIYYIVFIFSPLST